LILACLAGLCLPTGQAAVASASGINGQTLAPQLFDPPRQPAAHAFFDQWPAGEASLSSAGAEEGPEAPPPASVPLPPALLPAAVVLGWAILRGNRRRRG
jgi:hypothetical protein